MPEIGAFGPTVAAFVLVTYEDRIELVPVADDPLAAVREAAGELRDASVDDIRADIEAEAKAEARESGDDR
ncbi:AbrB/MazE/SpoVT family DNA-binding domain-containing protein [Natrinema sp. 1APR25-10V2]|uniref:AbrB/MazE/SpoVT family DNA-binding domain-containing protein n=1 Tax=Natrinema sp. 1APR25-10V2 TaxID=2951081 RepID=UPI0031F2EDD5